MPTGGIRPEEAPDLAPIERELETAIRLSLDSLMQEPLPEQIGLLLMRLAMAEMLKHAAQQEGKQETATRQKGMHRKWMALFGFKGAPTNPGSAIFWQDEALGGS